MRAPWLHLPLGGRRRRFAFRRKIAESEVILLPREPAWTTLRRVALGSCSGAHARRPAPELTPERRQVSSWRPQRDLNPCYRLERAVSWARLDDGDNRGAYPSTRRRAADRSRLGSIDRHALRAYMDAKEGRSACRTILLRSLRNFLRTKN